MLEAFDQFQDRTLVWCRSSDKLSNLGHSVSTALPSSTGAISIDGSNGLWVEAMAMTTGTYGSSGLSQQQEELVMQHIPAVRFIARRIHLRLPKHIPIEDLFSAGVVGLIDAVNKFDPSKQVQFSTYAQFRIHGAILDMLRELDWGPRELRRKGRTVEQAIEALTTRLDRVPNEEEIASEMGVSLMEYHRLLRDLRGLEIGSLHVERGEDSSEEELAYIAGAPEDDPLFQCLRGEMRQRLIAAIDNLPERERLVLTLYYYEELNMKEIALALGVVESRVSQIHASAVLHLRAKLADLGARERRTASPVSLPARMDPRKRKVGSPAR
jgi:RNA polymerase sigma factor for flagellar operon FliA